MSGEIVVNSEKKKLEISQAAGAAILAEVAGREVGLPKNDILTAQAVAIGTAISNSEKKR